MNIGTRSVLFGAHQFVLHPVFVFFAWWQLYGFPWDPRLWVAFIVHDLGYLGKPNMDGKEGETHPELGAKIMHRLFDKPFDRARWICPHPDCFEGVLGGDDPYLINGDNDIVELCPVCDRLELEGRHWHDFTLYHSRFYAKKHGAKQSPLCIADKLATVLMPWWLYLALTNLSGEVHEYMDVAHHREGGKYAHEIRVLGSQREWFESMCDYMMKWIEEHKDGRPDTWTPAL